MHFLAIAFPPLAILCCGKPLSAVLNLFLLPVPFIGLPAIIHALSVVKEHKADRRHTEALEVMSEGRYRRRR